MASPPPAAPATMTAAVRRKTAPNSPGFDLMPGPVQTAGRSQLSPKKKRAAASFEARRPSGLTMKNDYFRSDAARSTEPFTTKVAPHHLEAGPPGLIGVLNTPVAVWSLVKALQSPLFRSVS